MLITLTVISALFMSCIWKLIPASGIAGRRIGDQQSHNEIIDLDIVTPTYYGFDSLNSRTHMDPAWRTGLAALRKSYPQFNITHRFLMSKSYSCYDEKADVQFMLSDWYYGNRRPNSVPVILTTGCQESDLINQLAANWNMLMIITVSTDGAIDDKRLSPTWISNSPIQRNIHAFINFLNYFNWTTILMVTDASPSAVPLYSAFTDGTVRELNRAGGFTVYAWKLFSGGRNVTETKNILLKSRDVTRVIFFYGDSQAMRRFLLIAADLNMTKGEFAFLSGRVMEHRIFGNFSWDYGDADDEKAREAFRSVLVQSHGPESPGERGEMLVQTWRSLSILAADQLPVLFLVSTHTAFQVLGQVISKVSSSKRTDQLRNGTYTAREFYNNTFMVDTGPITFNLGGARLMSVETKHFNFSSGSFETLLLMDERLDGDYDIKPLAHIDWFGSSVMTVTEPTCGFDGKKLKCQVQARNFVMTICIYTTSALLLLACVVFWTYRSIYLRWLKMNSPWWILEPEFLCVRNQSRNKHKGHDRMLLIICVGSCVSVSRTGLAFEDCLLLE